MGNACCSEGGHQPDYEQKGYESRPGNQSGFGYGGKDNS